MSHWLSKEDPVYYKRELKGLIAEAEENGLEVFAKSSIEGTMLYFRDGMGECAGVKIELREARP